MQERSLPLLGEELIDKLNNFSVAVFGIGGVGGFVCEALARQGVGHFTLCDFDVINVSNKNRQIVALESTLGMLKVEVMKKRILDINPQAKVDIFPIKINEESINKIDFKNFDYVVDCIDDVKGKIQIIIKSKENNVKVLSCCGTGNKLDPSKFQIKDISKTTVCPLAKKLRLALRDLNIKDVEVLFSLEEPNVKCDFIPSVSFVPSIAGLLIARHIILNI